MDAQPTFTNYSKFNYSDIRDDNNVRVYATKTFRRFQRKERISNATLLGAIRNANAGLIDAELGRGLIKQRVARQGQGKSGGYRTLIAYRANDRAVYLFGFAKNSRANIDSVTLLHWQAIAADVLAASDAAIDNAIADGEMKEV